MSSLYSADAILSACLACDMKSAANICLLMDNVGIERFWHFYHYDQFAMLDDINADQLAKLTKIFTLAEFVQGENVGSTAQIHKMLLHLRTKDPSAANELEIWAFHTSSNSYVPYGTSNIYRRKAHTVAEYHDLIQNRDEKNQRLNDEQSAAAKQHREDRARQHHQRQVEHRDSNAERQQVIQALEALPDPVGRLEQIARYPNQEVWYFPEQFARISADDLQRIEPAARELLLKKIGSTQKGEWGRLCKLLKDESAGERAPCSAH